MKDQMTKIKKTAKLKFGSFRQYCIKTGKNETTFTRTMSDNIRKLNNWLKPLGLKLEVKEDEDESK